MPRDHEPAKQATTGRTRKPRKGASNHSKNEITQGKGHKSVPNTNTDTTDSSSRLEGLGWCHDLHARVHGITQFPKSEMDGRLFATEHSKRKKHFLDGSWDRNSNSNLNQGMAVYACVLFKVERSIPTYIPHAIHIGACPPECALDW